MKQMKYKKLPPGGKYKYELLADVVTRTDIHPTETIVTEYIKLTPNGLLFVKKGYVWDGPSGPTFDTETFMRGSLIHDALYQLMREGHLAQSWRKQADIELIKICKEDGMIFIRRWWVYGALRLFGGAAAKRITK